jgi:hypothetical protein
MPLIAIYGAGGTKADVVGSISAYDMTFLHIVTSPLVPNE